MLDSVDARCRFRLIVPSLMNGLEMDLNGLKTAEIALSLDRNKLQRKEKKMKRTKKDSKWTTMIWKETRTNCNRFKRDLKRSPSYYRNTQKKYCEILLRNPKKRTIMSWTRDIKKLEGMLISSAQMPPQPRLHKPNLNVVILIHWILFGFWPIIQILIRILKKKVFH